MIVLNFLIVLASVPDGRIFGLDGQTLIQIGAQLLNLVILAFFLAKFLYKPVRNALKKREDRVEGELAQAEEEMAKATGLKLEYEQKMQEIQQERDEVIGEARKLAAETSRRLIADAKKDAEALKERTEANIALEWEQAETEMRNAIIEASALMAEKIITFAINKEAQDRLFDETMAGLEGTRWRS